VVGVLLAGVFVAVVAVYVCTEFLMARFDARRRVMVGEGWPLLSILLANLASFLVVWLSSLVFLFAAGAHLYDYATIVCLCAQAVWLSQHLWFYHRNHLRLRYE
jgi:cytosine/uracil/thiamine/allantoin permease